MCKLDLPDVKKAIKEFNDNPINLATDYLTHSQFQELSNQNLPAMVLAIDGLWATQLYRDKDAINIILDSLRDNWGNIQQSLKNLQKLPTLYSNPSEQEIKEIATIAQNVFQYILFLKGNHKIKKHYVFTTKFFHWCAPDYFPIDDSRSRNAINKRQCKNGIPRNNRIAKIRPPFQNLEQYILSEYTKWLIFYSDLFIHNEAMPKEIQDCNNQKKYKDSPFYIKNTSLRILDKYFYTIGKDE